MFGVHFFFKFVDLWFFHFGLKKKNKLYEIENKLQCSARYGTFISECENDTVNGKCNSRCRELLHETLKTQQGAAFQNCTCNEQEDKLCQHLKNVILKNCMLVSEFFSYFNFHLNFIFSN